MGIIEETEGAGAEYSLHIPCIWSAGLEVAHLQHRKACLGLFFFFWAFGLRIIFSLLTFCTCFRYHTIDFLHQNLFLLT